MKTKRLLAMFLCVVMLLSSAPAVWAAEDAVTVSFLYADGTEMKTLLSLTVSDGTAERYGYEPVREDHTGASIETVTVMDVLVAAHAQIYGEKFTSQTARDYFIADNSFITKAFGVETSTLSFTINGSMPHDDTYIQSSWGGYYTGYAVDTARVQDGDRVTLFMYKDPKWMDIQPLFDCPDLVQAGEAFTVTVSGYSIMPYGCDKQENIDADTRPLAGVTLEYTQDFETFTTLGTLDAVGKLSVTLPQEGTYYLVVRGALGDDPQKAVPLVAEYHAVEVGQVVPPLVQPSLYVPFFFYPVIRRVGSDVQVALRVFFFDLRAIRGETMKVTVDLFTVPMQWFFNLFNR